VTGLGEVALWAFLLLGQGSDDQAKAEAKKHLEHGNALLLEGKPAEALAAYEAAYAAYPSPKISFSIAEAKLELGRAIEAAEGYERVIRELAPDSPLVLASKEKLAAADARLGRLSIATLPEGAEIEVGGKAIGTAPIDRLRVDPGSVEVTARLGADARSETIEIAAGEERSVQIDLTPIPPPPPPIVEEEPITSKWWFWTAIGAGVVVAGAAVGVAVATTGGDDFVPMGELGTTTLDEWSRR
jgi:hypothetical protein